MNKEKMIYTEKGEGKSATEETRRGAKSKALNGKKESKGEKIEKRSKEAGFYVHGHKNYGDVYEA